MSGLEAVDFPRTHNIRILMALVPSDVRPGLAVDLQDRLTEYATLTRYPGDYEPIPLTEAQGCGAHRSPRASRGPPSAPVSGAASRQWIRENPT